MTFFTYFLSALAAHGRSWAKDWPWATAVAMPDPLTLWAWTLVSTVTQATAVGLLTQDARAGTPAFFFNLFHWSVVVLISAVQWSD